MISQLSKICCLILILFSSNTVLISQSANIELKRVKLDWFNLLVPKNSEYFEPHGSVDGGNINSKEIEVEFNYWQNGEVPLHLKNTIDANSKPPILVCSDKLQTKTWKTLIDGKQVIAQTCFDKKDSKFFYHITFPRLKVIEVEHGKFRYGRFNLTITYKNKLYLSTAKKIANSLKFNTKLY